MMLKTRRSHNIAILITFLILSLILDQKSKAWGASVSEPLLSDTDHQDVFDEVSFFDRAFDLLSGFSIADDNLLSITATDITSYQCRQSGLTPLANTDILLQETESPQVQEFVLLASYKDDDSARDRVERHIYLLQPGKEGPLQHGFSARADTLIRSRPYLRRTSYLQTLSICPL